MKKITRSKNYSSLIKDLASIIAQGRKTVVRSVNTVLVAAYWLMGKKIIEFEQKGKKRAEYGEATLARISNDLMGKYGKGFSLPQLKNIRQFYLSYSKSGFMPTIQLNKSRKSYTLSIQSRPCWF